MTFPRITAVFFVLILIGVVSIVSIGGVAWIGPTLAHGTHVQHDAGIILKIIPNTTTDFEFKSDTNGTRIFSCRAQCRFSLGHLQRHINEKAHTDVYYTQGPNNTLLVVDVD